MQFLDRTGVGTLWSMCKTKFALKDHSHNYLPLSGGTLTGDLLFSNSGTTFRQIRGTCGDNDFWRIGGGATGSNAGYMEIATADDGTEPIYVRQYIGTFSNITRTATLLDDSGNTSFPGTVAAAKFKGALEGNASTASNAATVNGHTVNANVPANAKFTDTNTWRGIQDNLTSTSTSESLSANQGRVLKGLVDGKANSSHTHNYAGSGSPGGSANSAIGVVDYAQTSKTIQIGYSGAGITPDQIKYIAGYTDGSGNVNAKIKDVSRDALGAWLGLGPLAYSSSSIPTNLSQLNNDKGFVTGSVSGNTITINGASTTWTNTWRGIQDNLTSSSTSDSLSANQGRILKSLVDSKANSNEVIKSVRVQLYGDTINGFTPNIVVTDNANQEQSFAINKANGRTNGLMSFKDKNKLDLIPDNLSDLCKFNFVNSISECRSDRINFFLRCPDEVIDLSPFDSYPDGTILLITTNNYQYIAHRSGIWFSNGSEMIQGQEMSTYKYNINLITKNNGTVYHYNGN